MRILEAGVACATVGHGLCAPAAATGRAARGVAQYTALLLACWLGHSREYLSSTGTAARSEAPRKGDLLAVAGSWHRWCNTTALQLSSFTYICEYIRYIEVLDVKVHVFILLLFASVPDCTQNQIAVSDTLRLLSDF